MRQQTLFDTGINCDYCNKDPGIGTNGNLFDGFFDADTKHHVCNNCKSKHYEWKNKTGFAGMFSELPVVIGLNIHQRKIKK